MEFKKTRGYYMSANKKDRIAFYVYKPLNDTPPSAIFQISHGMCEYVERYEPFIEFLCKNNILVCGNDHLGHKGSVKSKSGLGYFSKSNGDRHLTEDVNTLTRLMKKKFPDTKYFLFGHSMGSFVARDFASKYSSKIDGLILCGTSGVNPGAKFGIGLCNSMSLLLGDKFRSDVVYNTAFLNYNKNYKERFNQYDWLTKDNDIKSWFEKNEYCNFVFTLSAFRDMFTVLDRVSDDNWAYSLPFELPVYILAGDMDPVGNYGKGVKQVYKRLVDAGLDDVNLKLYKNLRHEILNEPEKDIVYNDILQWIKNHIWIIKP